jgi:hypothetical protein
MNSQHRASAALLPRNQLPVRVALEATWAREPVWALWRRENPLPLEGIKPRFLGSPARSLVTISMELPRLTVIIVVTFFFSEKLTS